MKELLDTLDKSWWDAVIGWDGATSIEVDGGGGGGLSMTVDGGRRGSGNGGSSGGSNSSSSNSKRSGEAGGAGGDGLSVDQLFPRARRVVVEALRAGRVSLPAGQILVCKVFLGRCGRESEARGGIDGGGGGDGGDGGGGSSSFSAAGENGSEPAQVRRQNYPGYHSVYRIDATDPKQVRASYTKTVFSVAKYSR